MVLSLIYIYLCSFKLNAAVFNVDMLGNEKVEIVLPETGVRTIMKLIDNPVVTIKDIAEFEVNKKKILLQYNSGASSDPVFVFYWIVGNSKKSFEVQGTKLIVSLDGNFIVSGHTNSMFNIKRIIFFNGKTFEEIKQPFYALGISSAALANGVAKNQANVKSSVVFTFKKNEELEILISDLNQEYFLVKNKTGVVGWLNIPKTQRPTIFKEIYFAGD